MKMIYKYFIKVLMILVMTFTFFSCEEYLDQAPDAGISSTDVYKDFKSFQGFTEELYGCIVDVSKILYTSDYNLADETRMNVTFFLGNKMDAGDYWGWQTSYGSYFGKSSNYKLDKIFLTNNGQWKGIWWNSWYGIRKANIGLANLDLLVEATTEEKKFIEGQLLFFRAYFHFVLMRDWGGMPYIDWELSPDEEMNFPRLSYRETALKAAADFEAAAELLPIDWDDTEAGKRTLGDNRQRINKIMALSFLGKNLLYAASPLMNKESKGVADYDAELCKQAAQVFGDVINLCEETGRYSLQPWETYSDIFYKVSSNSQVPGGSEVIMNPPVYNPNKSRPTCMWGVTKIGHTGQQTGVTANYVKYWGMKNGLPINDPESGFDSSDPWSNRDPRFYKMILVDGDQLCNSTKAGADRFAQLYTNGRHRNSANNVTGYLSNKYWGLTCNKFDNAWAGSKYQYYPPLMRMADVYLMYAEATLQGYGTPQSSVPGGITALAAVNKVRNRATVPNIHQKFTTSKDAFMEQIVLERAVELSFENMRWNDLRRWLKNGDPRYLDKTELMFDRGPNGKPVNMQERLMVRRVVEEKHNWLPLPLDQVSLYSEFYQNPGW